MRGRWWRLAAATALAMVVGASAAWGDFPDDPPDDPNYDQAEENCLEHPVIDEQYYLFDFIPLCSQATASDPEEASGMAVNAAWRDFSIGDPSVLIAYIEAGINWHDGSIAEIADKVYVNPGELPPPEADNGDPWLNAPDWPSTPDANGNGSVDAEDLIVAFSDGVDDDGNG